MTISIKMYLLRIRSNVYISRRLMAGYMHHNRTKYWLERVGTREMVCHGMNGLPLYIDRYDFPFPALRYKETTPEIQALYEKQKGDWKLLTCEEKKMLYRSNYGQTFAEFMAPNRTEWMAVVGYGLMCFCAATWVFIWIKLFVTPDLPETFRPAIVRAQMRRQIDMRVNPITGLTSNWDYEKNDWKVKRWYTPPNPFIRCPDDDE